MRTALLMLAAIFGMGVATAFILLIDCGGLIASPPSDAACFSVSPTPDKMLMMDSAEPAPRASASATHDVTPPQGPMPCPPECGPHRFM